MTDASSHHVATVRRKVSTGTSCGIVNCKGIIHGIDTKKGRTCINAPGWIYG